MNSGVEGPYRAAIDLVGGRTTDEPLPACARGVRLTADGIVQHDVIDTSLGKVAIRGDDLDGVQCARIARAMNMAWRAGGDFVRGKRH